MQELDLDSTPREEGDTTEVEAAWDKEIASRVSEIESGKAVLVPYAQVEAEMDQFVAGHEATRALLTTLR